MYFQCATIIVYNFNKMNQLTSHWFTKFERDTLLFIDARGFIVCVVNLPFSDIDAYIYKHVIR